MRFSILLPGIALLTSCQWTRYYTPPPIAQRTVDLALVQKGRRLFAQRCIECHTLPPVWRYQAEDWPQIVNSMAHRAALTSGEREAIIAYILAARAE
ncbi:MAG TPA: cytochrome c [Chthoniobacterales bacterium]|nr:cytochrome c [Chthoniobacterales bacterium]